LLAAAAGFAGLAAAAVWGAPLLVTPLATLVGARVIAGDGRVPELSTVAVAGAGCVASGFACSVAAGAGCSVFGFTCSAGAGAGCVAWTVVVVFSSGICLAP